MSLLRARGPKAAEVPQLTGLQIQTSSNAVPIAIVYGINKVAPNLIWTGNFQSTPQYTKTGGKGGGKKSLSGYNYQTGLALGLCEGPITTVGTIWNGQSFATLASLGLNLLYGSSSQAPWSFLSEKFPSQALSYRGLVYAVNAAYDLGSSASLGSLQFEVYGLKYTSAVVNAHDADPAWVIYDFLTNSQYGVGFPAASIDATTLFGESDDSSYQIYCQAVGLAISPALTNRETANSILTRWLKLTNSEAVWSGGKLKFIPYGDTSITGNLHAGGRVTFNPKVTPIYSLTDDDFVGDEGEDPVSVVRKDPYSMPNTVVLEISQRSAGYNSVPVNVWDQNAIELYGLRTGSSVAAHEICEVNIAQTIGQLMLQRDLYIRNTYSFKLSFEYCLLEPMDVVSITDAALGLSNARVRIISIEEDDDGILSVTAEEFPGGTGTSVVYPIQENQGTALDHALEPEHVNPPVIFEPPAALTDGVRQIWIAVSGGAAYKLSEDGATSAHYGSATLASQTSGTEVTLTATVQTGDRAACRLRIYNGSANQDVDFDLTAGTASGATGGITAYSIIPIAGGARYTLSIKCNMAATAAPIVYVMLAAPTGTTSYAGTVGKGIYVWSIETAFGTADPVAVSLPLTLSAAMMPANMLFDAYWGGCLVHISTDDATYGQIGQIGQINGPARHGESNAALASGGSTLSVNLNRSGGTLDPASAADAANGVTLSLLGDELLAYGGTGMTGTNTYNLTNLARGLYGTVVPASHASGSRFARLDDAIFKYVLPAAYVGQTLYLKFQSFNIFGQALEDLSTCTAYTYVPNGAGAGLGPVASALAVGSDLDYGAASAAATISDDFGLASDTNVTTIDLGLASA